MQFLIDNLTLERIALIVTFAAIILRSVSWRTFQKQQRKIETLEEDVSAKEEHIDRLGLAALETESRLSSLEKIENRYFQEMARADRLSMQLLETELGNDKLAQQLAERTLEMEDARAILEQQSAHITMMAKVDQEEKKRLELLESVVKRSDKIIESFIGVRIDGNGRSHDGKIVQLMSKHFSVDELNYFCRFNLGEKAENIHDGGTLIDRCADVYMWAERQGRVSDLMKALRSERPNVDW